MIVEETINLIFSKHKSDDKLSELDDVLPNL